MDFQGWVAEFAGRWRSFADLPRVDEFVADMNNGLVDAWFDALGASELEIPQHDPYDPLQRFIVLNALLQLSRMSFPGDDADDAAQARSAAQRAYHSVLDLVTAEEVSSEEWVRWEIVAAAEGCNWRRVAALFDAWRQLAPDDRDSIEQLRGRVLWLSVWLTGEPPETRPPVWLPDTAGLFGTSYELLVLLKSVSIMPMRDAEGLETPTIGPEERDRVIDALAALAKVPEHGQTSPLSLGIEASCRYLLAHHDGSEKELGRAASLYQALAHNTTGWEGYPDAGKPVVVTRAFESAVLSLKKARRFGEAEAVIKEWMAATGENPVTWEHLAEAQLKQQDIAGASESMLKAIASNDTYESDWRASLMVALVSERDPFAALESILLQAEAMHPAQHELARSLTERYWPNFRALTEQTRKYWIHGLLLRHDPSFAAPLGDMGRQSAGHAFAVAVEGELRRTVFDPFVRETPWLKSLIEIPLGSELLVKHAKRPGLLTLGQMATALRECLRPTDRVMSALQAYVQARLPTLLRLTDQVDSIVPHRNQVSHDYIDEAGFAILERNAERVLDVIAQG